MIGGALASAMFLASAPPLTEELPLAAPSSTPAATTTIQPIAEPAGPPTTVPPPPSAQLPSASAETATGSPTASPDDIVVTARPHNVPGDPLRQVNAESFAITQSVDKAFVGPVSLAYKHALPAPVRSGLRNFLNNLHEPVVAVNFLLQLRPGKAVETAGRFAINSTIGAAGVFDLAKRRPFNLRHRPNGFADTMGFYGVKPGAFLFLPLIGATTVRDLIGGTLDGFVLPLAVGRPFNRLAFTGPTGVIRGLDRRVEFDEKLQTLRASANPYAAARAFYLQRRQAEIDELRGGPSRQTPPS